MATLQKLAERLKPIQSDSELEDLDHELRWLVELIASTNAYFKRVDLVCTENSILIDYLTEPPNVRGDDRAALLLPDPGRLAVQVEEAT
jgi:hypothetical protein